jgi:DNA-binding winged helix-turn-helix (wHTH) protein/Tol biopolymer transport system component
MTQSERRVYEFGEFRLDATERLLLRKGEPLPLTPKVFDTLLKLVEDHGRLIEKDEFMERLWPGLFVSEDTLAHNISLIRKVLDDGANGQQFIATVPKRGYRFVASVRAMTDGRQGTLETEPADPAQVTAEGLIEVIEQKESFHKNSASSATVPASRGPMHEVPPHHRKANSGFRFGTVGLIAAAVSVGLIAGVITFTFLSPPRVPRVVAVTQITHSGRVDPWRGMVSDGSRIYFLERAGDHWNLMQTSVRGGEPQIVNTPFRSTLLLDISPDRTEFLIASFTARGELMPLWIWPVQGGGPRRIGEVMAFDAAWFPGGRQIIYAHNDGVFVAERDGTGSRLIVATQGRASRFAWSPDGRKLRFGVSNENSGYTSAIWEADADGKHLHRLFPGWSDPPNEWYGTWSADGNYFFLDAWRDGLTNVWAAQEKPSWMRRRQGGPVRLTAGPEEFSRPMPTGRRLFVIGSTGKAELVHFDPKSRQSTTLFANTHGWGGARYSRDGQWAVLTGENLRKIKADGSGEVSLTVPPLITDAPAWSPDGKQLAFGGRTHGDRLWKLYVTSSDGGTPREIVPSEGEQAHPTWSPDGKLLAFDQEEKSTSRTSAMATIQILNMTTNQLSLLQGSQGKIEPSWSADGHFLAALSEDGHKLMLFDLHTQSWSQLAEGDFIGGPLTWSGDSKFLYFQDLLAPNQPVNRFRMDNRRIERVASFEVFLQGGIPRCGFQGLTPDGALLVALLRNLADIYSLDIELP